MLQDSKTRTIGAYRSLPLPQPTFCVIWLSLCQKTSNCAYIMFKCRVMRAGEDVPSGRGGRGVNRVVQGECSFAKGRHVLTAHKHALAGRGFLHPAAMLALVADPGLRRGVARVGEGNGLAEERPFAATRRRAAPSRHFGQFHGYFYSTWEGGRWWG
jgi:hypothetical protein